MAAKNARKEHKPTTRASISFSPEIYVELNRLAKQKKVSVAWLVREAVEKYVIDQWPLFGKSQGKL